MSGFTLVGLALVMASAALWRWYHQPIDLGRVSNATRCSLDETDMRDRNSP